MKSLAGLGYEKADPALMLKIGDWKQFGRNECLCGSIGLKRSGNQILVALQKRGVRISPDPPKGQKKIYFHDTPVSVIADLLPLKSVKCVYTRVAMEIETC